MRKDNQPPVNDGYETYRQQQREKFLFEKQQQEALAAKQQEEALALQQQEKQSKISALMQAAKDVYQEIRIFQKNFYDIFSGKLVEDVEALQKKLEDFKKNPYMDMVKDVVDLTLIDQCIQKLSLMLENQSELSNYCYKNYIEHLDDPFWNFKNSLERHQNKKVKLDDTASKSVGFTGAYELLPRDVLQEISWYLSGRDFVTLKVLNKFTYDNVLAYNPHALAKENRRSQSELLLKLLISAGQLKNSNNLIAFLVSYISQFISSTNRALASMILVYLYGRIKHSSNNNAQVEEALTYYHKLFYVCLKEVKSEKTRDGIMELSKTCFYLKETDHVRILDLFQGYQGSLKDYRWSVFSKSIVCPILGGGNFSPTYDSLYLLSELTLTDLTRKRFQNDVLYAADRQGYFCVKQYLASHDNEITQFFKAKTDYNAIVQKLCNEFCNTVDRVQSGELRFGSGKLFAVEIFGISALWDLVDWSRDDMMATKQRLIDCLVQAMLGNNGIRFGGYNAGNSCFTLGARLDSDAANRICIAMSNSPSYYRTGFGPTILNRLSLLMLPKLTLENQVAVIKRLLDEPHFREVALQNCSTEVCTILQSQQEDLIDLSDFEFNTDLPKVKQDTSSKYVAPLFYFTASPLEQAKMFMQALRDYKHTFLRGPPSLEQRQVAQKDILKMLKNYCDEIIDIDVLKEIRQQFVTAKQNGEWRYFTDGASIKTSTNVAQFFQIASYNLNPLATTVADEFVAYLDQRISPPKKSSAAVNQMELRK